MNASSLTGVPRITRSYDRFFELSQSESLERGYARCPPSGVRRRQRRAHRPLRSILFRTTIQAGAAAARSRSAEIDAVRAIPIVDHHEHQVRIVDGARSTLDADALHGVRCLPKPRGIVNIERDAGNDDPFTHHVPGWCPECPSRSRSRCAQGG